jgi:hypothetical protein
MGLIDQMKEVLDLLNYAKEDLEAWVTTAETDMPDADTEITNNLISEIETVLHNVGY